MEVRSQSRSFLSRILQPPSALLFLLLLAAPARANILVDPSFENLSPTGTRGAGTYLGNHTNGWYVLTSGCYLYWADWFGVPPPGQVAHLNNSTLQQVFDTEAGGTYRVAFYAVASEPTQPDKHATVWIDNGNRVGSAPAGVVATYDTGQVNGSWQWPSEPYTFEFIAQSRKTTLSVEGFSRVPVDAFAVELIIRPRRGPILIVR